MNAHASYAGFIAAKVKLARAGGEALAGGSINPLLKGHQRDAVAWAVQGRRRAIFAAFGLGKTFMQLEWLRIAAGGGYGLITAPYGVRREFAQAARQLASGEHPLASAETSAAAKAWLAEDASRAPSLTFIRSDAEIGGPGLYWTNFESVREGKIDPRRFQAASLDEAACLRAFGGSKTFREFMRLYEGVPAKLVGTATPSPNDHIEILAYAAYLEIMDVGEAKTRFFKRDSEKADNLTLHPHKEEEFWRWVASWALFIERPSDLGHDDAGYLLPEMRVHWHVVTSPPKPASIKGDGQYEMLVDAAQGLQEAAAEKRASMPARIAKAAEIVRAEPGRHAILWHDLEDERRALESALPGIASVYGKQTLEEVERVVGDFAEGRTPLLGAKPVMLGSGANLQRHCSKAVFVGLGYKFADFIQAIHRIRRFGQSEAVDLHLIHSANEWQVAKTLKRKWSQHEELVKRMTDLIRKYGLSAEAMAAELQRAGDVARVEVRGENFRAVNNDNVEELRSWPDNSVAHIVTSIPFANQYEYTPNLRDFGHTDDLDHFFAQMDFLTPELLRVLEPGRIACIHVKDRVTPGGVNGLGFQTVEPFHAHTLAHFRRHGFHFMGMRTIATDVVRENNQTYRLSYTEQCKDGTKMSVGMSEYVLIFRKAPTSREKAYADRPVTKVKKWFRDPEPTGLDAYDRAQVVAEARERWEARRAMWLADGPAEGMSEEEIAEKIGSFVPPPMLEYESVIAGRVWENPDGYSLARWQVDAHGVGRSSGDRFIRPEELGADPALVWRRWKQWSLEQVYDYEHHVFIGEALALQGRLPTTFMLVPPHAAGRDDVWTDVTRMRTLNTFQSVKGLQQHLCPLQFDIVEWSINRFSEPGELVLDPFGGLMTVPYCAVRMGRKGAGIELNPGYWADGVKHCEAAERGLAMPTLFDLIAMEEAERIEAAAQGVADRILGPDGGEAMIQQAAK